MDQQAQGSDHLEFRKARFKGQYYLLQKALF